MKRHLISAGITFIGSFLMFVLPVLTDPSWSYTGKAALVALILAGVRAGIKTLWEKFSPQLQP